MVYREIYCIWLLLITHIKISFNESKVIDEYITNQQQKINDLTQHIMVLETKIRVLEHEKNNLLDKLKIVEDINSEYKKTYRQSPFK